MQKMMVKISFNLKYLPKHLSECYALRECPCRGFSNSGKREEMDRYRYKIYLYLLISTILIGKDDT